MKLLKNNIPEYSVSEFNKIINETVSTAFSHIKIRGEISNLKKHYSGHIFFNLKDENSIINAVCWRTNVTELSFKPEEGIEVVATGKISTFAKSISVYQINIEDIKIAGEGALLKLIQQRKKILEKKGFFDKNKKLPIPFIPNSIGVITSPTGSVISDIIHRIRERFPRPIQLWPVAVQGENSSKEIIRAIEGFNMSGFCEKPDVIIIARGGGSIEDLMPFNSEDLAKSVFNSKIPIITAIGHETDTTIIDYVSDLRAPTATAAAEMCVPVRNDLIKSLSFIESNMNNSMKQKIIYNHEKFEKLTRLLKDPSKVILFFYSELKNIINRKNYNMQKKINEKINNLNKLSSYIKNPTEKLNNYKLILENLWNKIDYPMFQNIRNNKNQLKGLSRLLYSSSTNKILQRGYSIVRKNNKIITKAKFLKEQDLVDLQFIDDSVLAKIKKN